ncbi:AAA family ATPase [Salibacter halophilus]|uniref:MoxR family ATPase n=1 Tax=Salibacter halophilus TaxID=1803916 RepID=A0A6N6MCH8_9FLAO|nr:MoxR family ATPase [Salibacter halophilus]KAB1065098.1 MoxR family ATPase [Salibacter halophilus]
MMNEENPKNEEEKDTNGQNRDQQIPEDQKPAHEVPTPRPETNIVQESVEKIKKELHQVIIGMDNAIDETMVALFTNSHVLFEGFPGVAKTLLVKLVSQTLSVDFKRIQFTPDLMPSDVLGTMVFDQKSGNFSFHKGPIFSNLVLIDEINRAPAKTQAALFEVMEERQVTMEGETYPLEYPFLVIGTQNPIDQEGTYRLPEGQLDRFVFKIKIPYPSIDEEQAILDRFKSDFNRREVEDNVKAVMNTENLKKCESFIEQIHISDEIIKYLTSLIHATRDHESIYLGGSPRASLAILKTSKAFAAIAGRSFVKPDDIQRACMPVLNHRLILSASAEMEGYSSEDIIKSIIDEIEVPR